MVIFQMTVLRAQTSYNKFLEIWWRKVGVLIFNIFCGRTLLHTPYITCYVKLQESCLNFFFAAGGHCMIEARGGTQMLSDPQEKFNRARIIIC